MLSLHLLLVVVAAIVVVVVAIALVRRNFDNNLEKQNKEEGLLFQN
jgi:hypothetical protein